MALRACSQSDSAGWVAKALSSGTIKVATVASIVPQCYEAYARILHPVTAASGRQVSWGSVAQAAGGKIHAAVQWGALSRGVDDQVIATLDLVRDGIGYTPEVGDLAVKTMRSLFGIIEAEGMATRCVAAYWTGWEGPLDGPARICIPRLATDREYMLFSGTLQDVVEQRKRGGVGTPVPYSPNFLWACDRAWFISTEIDYDSTIVGGDNRLIDAILSHKEIEALAILPSGSLAIDADEVNR